MGVAISTTLDSFVFDHSFVLKSVCVLTSAGCLAKSVRNFFALVTKVELGRAKDFDLYYFPIFISMILGSISIIYTMLNGPQGTVSPPCSEEVTIVIFSVVGGCLLQIAINWLEVVG